MVDPKKAEDFESFDEPVDDEDEIEELGENDEISPEEEAFMRGYEEDEETSFEEKEGDKLYEEAFEEDEED